MRPLCSNVSKQIRFAYLGLILAACTGTVEPGTGSGTKGPLNSSQGGTGSTSGTPMTPSGSAQATGPAILPSRVVSRLTREEYNNVVRDLLGDNTQPGSSFSPEEELGGFHNNAAALSVSSLLVTQFYETAVDIASRAVSRTGVLPPCALNANPEPSCTTSFVNDIGLRAWRRPLTTEEQSSLRDIFTVGAKVSPRHGYELVIQSLLIGAPFLFRVEPEGTPAKALGLASDTIRPSSWEMASRLSFALWNTMPDATLFSAAKDNALQTPSEISGQVTRMLKDPKARDMTLNFFTQWLGIANVAAARKDAGVFPKFVSGTGALLRKESELFVQDAMWGPSAGLRSLMLGSGYFANDALARYYGIDAGPLGAQFTQVVGRSAERSGVLTLGGVMAALAKTDQTLPPARGKFVRERFLCLDVPPPPPNVNNAIPAVQPGVSARERFVQHDQASCASCHRLMDPIGFGFERYDGAGVYRAVENGKAIDESGEVVDLASIGRFQGASELSSKLLAAPEFRACLVRQVFRFSMGRTETTQDTELLAQLESRMSEKPGNELLRLFVALTETETFQLTGASAP